MKSLKKLPWARCDNYWNNLNSTAGPICTNTRQLSYCDEFHLTDFLRDQEKAGLFVYNETFSTDLLPTIYENCTSFNADFTCADNDVVGNTKQIILDKVPLFDIRDLVQGISAGYSDPQLNETYLKAGFNKIKFSRQVVHISLKKDLD